MSLPNGVVTFLFSDIEGSTHLWESDPEGMRSSLSRHDEIVRSHVRDAGGFVFKHTGDGFAAAFGSVTAAVASAATIADALQSERWVGPSLRVRIGVHAGEAEPNDGDYFGPAITRTARVMDAANGGQIVVADGARRLIGDQPPDGTVLNDLGEHRLKDLGEPIRLHRLICPGAEDDRPLRTLERAPHNLPVQLTTFVGREGHIKEVNDLVRQARLVTLTGIGGVGKTRLSLQVAAELLSEFEHGAWFTELASLGEAGLLADTVSEAISVPQDSTVSAEERLIRYLSERRALLVIDNCEHLIDDVAGFVDRLLHRCPDVHVLTTSREGLAVMGEALWRVPSLRVDDDAAAVDLFADRARLVQPRFVVTDANRKTVADLCVRLDGIPLAIELATARLKMLSVEQIAEHLSDRFRLLTGGSRTVVERQRTLRAMMDWSYDLLGAEEQALLRRLSVFYDGFTYEAAEEVCSGETLARFEVLDLLGRLVEASVVTFDADTRPRYRLLETVRQYALDKLVEAGEADEARERHAEFFRTVSGRVREALDRNEYSWMDLTTDDLGNFRAALTWAIETNRGSLALDISCSLRAYFWNRVMYRESLKWLTASLGLVDDEASDQVPLGAAFALTDAVNVGDADAIGHHRPRVERLHAAAEGVSKGLLANAIASLLTNTDVAESDRLYRQSHELLRAAGEPRWAAPLQNRFINAWLMNSRESEEEILHLVDLAESTETALHGAVVRTVFRLLAEDYEGVIDFVEAHDPVDDWEEVMLLIMRSCAERALGRFDDALDSLSHPHAILRVGGRSLTFWEMGMLYLQLGDIEQAVREMAAAEPEDPAFPNNIDRVHEAHFWSIVSQRRGDLEAAAVLAGYADTLGRLSSVSLLNFDLGLIAESRDSARRAIGDETYEEYFARGEQTSWDELPLVHG